MFSELVELAWPIAAAILGETALGLVDTKIVGGLGATPPPASSSREEMFICKPQYLTI